VLLHDPRAPEGRRRLLSRPSIAKGRPSFQISTVAGKTRPECRPRTSYGCCCVRASMSPSSGSAKLNCLSVTVAKYPPFDVGLSANEAR
jgi:hypothetical protein